MIAQDDPLFAQAKQQFGQTLGAEYTEQFVRAIRSEVGIDRNDEAIEAVRRQLVGES